MTRRAVALALGTLLAASCSMPWTSTPNQSPGTPELAIASDLPLSGILGVGVRPLRDAIALAIHDRGTVGGYRLTYLSLDDALIGTFNSAKAEQNVKLMINDSRVVGVVGPFSSGAAGIAIQLANPANLAMVSPSNTADCLTYNAYHCFDKQVPDVNNYFRIASADSAQASATARFAFQTLHLTRFAVLDDGSFYGRNLAEAFAGALTAIGGTVVLRKPFSATENDHTGLLHDALVAQAQAIYVGGPGETGACRIRAQMPDVFPADAYMLGDDGMAGPSCVADAGLAANDHFLAMVSDSQPPIDSKVYKEFKAHNIPPAPYTFAAYDCAQIIADAIGRAIQANGGKAPTRRQVLDAVASTLDFAGASGSFTFLPTGDATNPSASVYRVQDGRWTFWQNAPSLPKTTATTPLDGRWEVDFTRRELLRHTSDPDEDNPGNYGHLALEFNRGNFRLALGDGSVTAGTYEVTGNVITFYRTDSQGPGEIWTSTWSVRGGKLTFVTGGPGAHPTLLIVKSWSRSS